MNDIDFNEISKRRVTTRQFDQKPVEDEKLTKILEAGRWSPTAVNYQPQRILVLNTPDSLSKVKEFCTFGYDQKYADLAKECDDKANRHNVYYYGAPLVLFVCYDKEACWTHPQSGESSGATDATIVSTHMMLEAASIGLGTVWISYFDKQKARELLNIPDTWEPHNMIYIGYPAKGFVPNPKMSGKRYPLSHSVWMNSMVTPYPDENGKKREP